jgi:hypothetical protein
MLELILAALLAFPAYHGDHETGEAREARLAPYAAGIASHARTADETAALVAIAWHETRLAAYVTDGRCHEGPAGQRCDNGRARGPWQLHGWCKATTPDGEAECAARLLRYARARCGSWSRAFGAYASGGRCYDMPEREATRRAVLARM